MKHLLTGMLLCTFAATAMAQSPMPQGSPSPTSWQSHVQQVQGNYLPVQPSMPMGGPGQPVAQGVVGVPAGCCPTEVCCEPMRKVCVAEPAVKKITTTCYSKTCDEFCLPKCGCCLSLMSCFNHGCDCCQNCEGPYPKYYLVKKIRTCECETFKCVPTLVPACGCR